MVYFVRPPVLLKKYYASLTWNIPTVEKIIYLTFDDGPTPVITDWTLAQLKQHNAKATFFCVGQNVKNHPAIFELIIQEGHQVGNHTFKHMNGWATGTDAYTDDVYRCHKIFSSTLFRPPYGKIRKHQVQKLEKNFRIVMWDVLSGDFDVKLSPEKCLANVLRNTRPGSIVVFHDSLKASGKLYYTLPRVLEHFSEKGFVFKALQ